jgi:ribose transport system substrate-binding protein
MKKLCLVLALVLAFTAVFAACAAKPAATSAAASASAAKSPAAASAPAASASTTASASAAASASASGSSSAPAKKDQYVIGMSQCNLGEPWRVAMNDQIAAAAAKHPEFKVIYSDAAQDNSKQIADIENFIQMGVDLLIASPNEATPLTNVIKKAYEAGIPVILLDRKIDGDTYTQFIGADNVYMGREAGKYVAQTLFPDGANLLEVKGLEGTSGGIDRDKGIAEGIADNAKIKILQKCNADWLREKAITETESMLQANPDVQCIIALNDPMAEGAYTAAKNLGREKDIKFIGFDGLPTPDGGIKSVMEGRLSLTLVYPTGGAEAIQSAYDLLEGGKTLEKTITLGTEIITPETAADAYTRYGGK